MQPVGRDQELKTLTEFVRRCPSGAGVHLLQGQAGIGKSTLLRHAEEVAHREGIRLLGARPTQAERALAFAALGDLIGEALVTVGDRLPAPQRRALRVALFLEDAGDGPPPEPRAVAAGLVSTLRAVAEPSPVLVTVDDVQWLDAASALALGFAMRRLPGHRVGVAVAQRVTGEPRLPLGLDRPVEGLPVEVQVLEPLDDTAIRTIVRSRVPLRLPRTVERRLESAVAGNPFYALELGRALAVSEDADPAVPLALPSALQGLVRDRLASLPAATRELLALVASMPQPTLGRLRAHEVSRDDLDAAVAAGVLVLDDDRLRFAHPLLASGAHDALSGQAQRDLRLRLGALTDDPEERAHHLAFAIPAPDAETAAALDLAAEQASRRGAIHAAADFHAQARRFTPAEDRSELRRRTAGEASCLRMTGDSPRARGLLKAALEDCPPGDERAALLYELGRVAMWGVDWRVGVELLEEALAAAGEEAIELRARIEHHLAMAVALVGEDLERVVRHARAAADLAERFGDRAMVAASLGLEAKGVALLAGEELPDIVDRCLALEPEAAALAPVERPSDYVAAIHCWHDDLAQGIAMFERLAEESLARGNETSLVWIHARMVPQLCAAGRWEEALSMAHRACALAEESGQAANRAMLLAAAAFVEAHYGNEQRTRELAHAAAELARTSGAPMAEQGAAAALGLLELSLGHFAAADRALAPFVLRARRTAVGEPGVLRFVPDAVEALLGQGRHEDAEELLGWYAARAGATGRVSALAAEARLRALLAMAHGQPCDGLAHAEESVRRQTGIAMPFDAARSLLVLGAVSRRARRKRAARDALEQARSAFEALGARLWAERAQAELDSIGGRTPSGDDLTAAERRVATLVAQGMRNRDVADTLFLSPKTVEFHLRNVFRKLDVRSRTELTRHLGAQQADR